MTAFRRAFLQEVVDYFGQNGENLFWIDASAELDMEKAGSVRERFQYKIPEDFYELDLALQVLIHKLEKASKLKTPKKEGNFPLVPKKSILIVDGLSELYATFELEDDLKEKISGGIVKLSKMGVTILVTRAINLEGRHDHKIPCKAGSVIPFVTTVMDL
ncbi:Oidioi.mRNA.OKI2018_I69.chr2.g5588.t1.cds [Oikopleura dioica]|uniref:Oidioi.mRNA.OKI2018_I69.chr2.g5588.t1.cds n=1 Tax=Oikopleura dioica TaxID=34765 RepID=A0ABN7T553_OIKDI|nr:Oidioi.mRNA.OKI2018_I69.chr2.g5588.t1.cds [Oikopleura dioica]